MKLQSISNLQELIKNLKVKKFGKRGHDAAEAGVGNGTGGKKDTSPEVIKDGNKLEEITKNTEKKEDTCDEVASRSWWLYRASMRVVSLLETSCSLWGRKVASSPLRAVLISLLVVAVLGLGLLRLDQEQRPYKLWVSQDSDFSKVNSWKNEYFPNKFRRHQVIWEADGNILTARAVKNMWRLHNKIENLQVVVDGVNIKWQDVCTVVPTLLSDVSDATLDDYDTTNATYDYDVEIPQNFSSFTWNNTSTLNWTSFNWTSDSVYNWTAEWEDQEYDYAYDETTTEVLPGEEEWLTEEERKVLRAVTPEIVQSVREDYSIVMTKPTYCRELASKRQLCYETSLLEVWGYDENVIMNLTDRQVLEDVNKAFMSKVYGYPFESDAYLGGISRDSGGRIVAARAALHTWITKNQMNKTMVVDVGTGEMVDTEGLAWEGALVEAVQEEDIPGINVHVHAAYSFGDVSSKTIIGDIKWVACGWAALIIYVLVTLGRPGPALVGLFCVALAVVAAYGTCSAIGIPHGPLNNVLPILLIGLGVDDMYVISNAWKISGNVKLLERAGRALQHAGVAVTVTSLSDAVAFLVGATTKVPALRWFCIYAAVGVMTVYVLQATVFVAALTVDQKYRERKNEDSMEKTSEKRKKTTLLSFVMRSYANIIVLPWMQATVLVAAASMMGAGIWGAVSLRQEFSPIWFLPRTSYLYHWFQAMDKHFPSDGELGTVYFSNVSLPRELPALRNLAAELRASPYITRVDAWYSVLDVYLLESLDYYNVTLTEDVLHDALGIFLHSKSGAQFNNNFLFEDELTCEHPAPPFSTFKINFQYERLEDRADQQAAMNQVRRIVSSANISGYHAVWAHVYSQWETDAAVGSELWRNLGLVACVVGIMTLLLLASPRAAFLVSLCVLATLTEVAALMHVWGLTIDIVTCIALVLAIGLCVDYAAHVAHAFLVVAGSRRQRVQAAVEGVGPAVLHGGFSTLLAFVMLSPSDSHLFISFFKIFIGVAVFGLFHGLVLMPVLLALIGPEPYPDYNSPPLTTVHVVTSPETPRMKQTIRVHQTLQPKMNNKEEKEAAIKTDDEKCPPCASQPDHDSHKNTSAALPEVIYGMKSEVLVSPILQCENNAIKIFVRDSHRRSCARRRSSSSEDKNVTEYERDNFGFEQDT
ncbi:NPC intracellular cholesterol transporter 1 homolog 1b-like [Penaeus japonicus]|uniref:NPC intracellular cholesterol transporter 1 homolog 1b-like n=1 Tax=Penaeus japonicus TaxID=27405 RepID=UPI001C70C041|nr:NPC intracellular cholesterol transporter 1 homolog 1b-like [Penaeus japonicus]